MAQMQHYVYPYKFLLSAIYDTADQIGARIIEGNSNHGVFRLRMPESNEDLLLQVASVSEDCEITLTPDTAKSQKPGSTDENDATQYFLSVLDKFLSDFEKA